MEVRTSGMPYHLRNMLLSSHLHFYSSVQFKAAKNVKYRKQSSRLMDSFNKYHPSSRCKMEGLWQWQTQTKSSVGPAKASNKISDTNVENVLLICPLHKLVARSKATLRLFATLSLSFSFAGMAANHLKEMPGLSKKPRLSLVRTSLTPLSSLPGCRDDSKWPAVLGACNTSRCFTDSYTRI